MFLNAVFVVGVIFFLSIDANPAGEKIAVSCDILCNPKNMLEVSCKTHCPDYLYQAKDTRLHQAPEQSKTIPWKPVVAAVVVMVALAAIFVPAVKYRDRLREVSRSLRSRLFDRQAVPIQTTSSVESDPITYAIGSEERERLNAQNVT